jgi:hypothetical protein
MPVTKPLDAGMLFDGTQFALVDIGDDIGDASDLKVLGSITSFGELGGTRPTLPNPHVDLALHAARRAYLRSRPFRRNDCGRPS